jgi:type II secretory pathway pseudopilin PulG
MKFKLNRNNAAGFTLAEVLAAMLFMAIVIPVAVQGLRVASMAGELAQRKSQAVRIAELVLNENLCTTNATQTRAEGVVVEGTREFPWTFVAEPWSQPLTNQVSGQTSALDQLSGGQPVVNTLAASQIPMNLVTVEVRYNVQGREHSLRLSTLSNPEQ